MCKHDVDWLRKSVPAIFRHEESCIRAIRDHMSDTLQPLYDNVWDDEDTEYFVHNLSEMYAVCLACLVGGGLTPATLEVYLKDKELTTVHLLQRSCLLMQDPMHNLELPWLEVDETGDLCEDLRVEFRSMAAVLNCVFTDESWKTASVKAVLEEVIRRYVVLFEKLFMSCTPAEAVVHLYACVLCASEIAYVIIASRNLALAN